MVDRVLALPEGTRALSAGADRRAAARASSARSWPSCRRRASSASRSTARSTRSPTRRSSTRSSSTTSTWWSTASSCARDIATRLADSFETALGLADGIAIAEFADKPLPDDSRDRRAPTRSQERDARAHHLLGALRLPGLRLHHRRDRAAAVLVQRAGRRLPDVRRPRHRAEVRGRPGRARRRRCRCAEGAIYPWAKTGATSPYYEQTLQALAKHYKVSMTTPWEQAAQARAARASCTAPARRRSTFVYEDGLRNYKTVKPFEGVIGNIERRWRETDSDWVREELSRYQGAHPCDDLRRLSPEAAGAGRQGRRQAHRRGRRPVDPQAANVWFAELPKTFTKQQTEIADAHPEGDPRAAAVPQRRRPRLSDAVARLRHAVGRREPAHPARLADRLRPDRRALRARRAVDRPASARQRAPARHAEAPARPRQHGDRRRARRGRDPARPTTSSTSAPAPASTAARSSPRARPTRSWPTPRASPGNTSPARGRSRCRRKRRAAAEGQGAQASSAPREQQPEERHRRDPARPASPASPASPAAASRRS